MLVKFQIYIFIRNLTYVFPVLFNTYQLQYYASSGMNVYFG